MLDTTELTVLKRLAAAPISRAASVVEANILCRLTKRQRPLVVYVRGFVGRTPVQAYVITEAGRARLAKEAV